MKGGAGEHRPVTLGFRLDWAPAPAEIEGEVSDEGEVKVYPH